MDKFIDIFLEQRMDSADGDELRCALEAIVKEEKVNLELFRIQINYCRNQISIINSKIDSGNPTHYLMTNRRAFEEQEFILNIAAQAQQCSYETKGLQKALYFEKNESSKERLVVEASVMMYEWCNDLQEMTGKKFQDIASKLLSAADLAKTRIARKRLQDFFKREKKVLSSVRHNTGAHRDHDYMKQREVLDGIGWSETIKRLHDFEEVTLELGKSISPLIKAGLKRIDKAFNGK